MKNKIIVLTIALCTNMKITSSDDTITQRYKIHNPYSKETTTQHVTKQYKSSDTTQINTGEQCSWTVTNPNQPQNRKLSFSDMRCFNVFKNTEPLNSHSFILGLQLIQSIPTPFLDFPINQNGCCIGQYLVNSNQSVLFTAWLKKGARCTALTGKYQQQTQFHNKSVLHALCLKEPITFTNLISLIEQVASKNPNLIAAAQGDGATPAMLALKNNRLSDDQTLKILKLFTILHPHALHTQQSKSLLDWIEKKDRKPKTIAFLSEQNSHNS
ncbi:MAG: hypothetical protein CL947_02720 [Epsilonproteobacteria bacterium]|nr:hypothetical protein [Campylobacterota bacterium]|tara:strand:+ start:2321 stop:3130 length:810 start_codon:yes stop_codon:yes gene_type:complete